MSAIKGGFCLGINIGIFGLVLTEVHDVFRMLCGNESVLHGNGFVVERHVYLGAGAGKGGSFCGSVGHKLRLRQTCLSRIKRQLDIACDFLRVAYGVAPELKSVYNLSIGFNARVLAVFNQSEALTQGGNSHAGDNSGNLRA